MIKTTESTLHQIGIEDIPMVYVFNKADRTAVEYPVMEGEDRIVISAKDAASIDLLEQIIRQHLFKDYQTATLLVPFAEGNVVSYLNEHTNILETTYEEAGTRLKVELSSEDLHRFENYLTE